VKYVVFYEGASDMEKARLHFPAHRERYTQFVAEGTLLMIGTFSNPAEGAMGVFTTRDAAQEFVKGAPSSSMAWSRSGASASGTRSSIPGRESGAAGRSRQPPNGS
jgi:uncharacterized protein YciI